MNRFFAESLEEAEVALTAFEAHHAVDVLRLGAGEQVELFDGAGRTAVGRIVRAGRGKAAVRIEQLRPTIRRGGPLVHLAFAVPKGKRLDWLLEKAAELAAASLRPVRFERSVAGGEMTEAKHSRWLAHCIAAAKQCGLNFLPQIRGPLSLHEFLADLGTRNREPGTGNAEHGTGNAEPGTGNREPGTGKREAMGGRRFIRLLGDNSPSACSVPEATAPSRGPCQLAIENRKLEIVILIGPEGGLTDAERQACVESGFTPVRLGSTALRIETAAVALLAAVTALLG